MKRISYIAMIAIVLISACSGGGGKTEEKKDEGMFTGAKGEVKLRPPDPGHFHSCPGQQSMYIRLTPVVHVYA